ncbi:T cell activation RhoGTPase activating protein a [Scleropages formosus]|uniref:T cell activation RhoGTPase activating protein a n=1 Tax=Scleropages formosus TaxID=113540 RepID=A0A8C9RZR2_SCLFO|nr:T-cell activation Rho GTPase-activating protein-like [Scleropages formosus]
MKVLGGYTVSKTLTEDTMNAVIDLPLHGMMKESLGDQVCNVEKPSGQSSGNGINRWRSLFLQIRRRSATQCDSSESCCSRAVLFGQPLSNICEDGVRLPTPIKDILVLLYKNGPSVEGIFRRACNIRGMRGIKEQLNSGEEVNMEEQSVILLAALLKDFLRHIPGRLLVEEQYQAWTAALDIENVQEKCKQLKLVLDSLPKPNILLLQYLLCLLLRISKDSSTNMMDAKNLAVCISPNLLQQDSVDAVEKVTSLTQFLIENCCEIFGESIGTLLDDCDEEELPDNLDSLSLYQQDSAYDSPDPDADIGDAIRDHQTIKVRKGPQQLSPGAVSKPFNRRCSEPIIYPSAVLKTNMMLTRSHDDFSMENADLVDPLLKKQNSDDSFLFARRGGRKQLPLQKFRGSSAMETPRTVSPKDSSYSSSCSLESASSNISEDSVFGGTSTTSSVTLQKAGPSPQSFSSICIEDVENRGKVAKRRPLSLRMEKKKGKNRGSMKKESNEVDVPLSNDILEQEVQEIAERVKPRTRPRSLSAMEVFQLVDSRRPSRPPSYIEAVSSSELPPSQQSKPITVQDARNMSTDRKSRPSSMIDNVFNTSPTSFLAEGYSVTEEQTAMVTQSVVFRPRAMSESVSRSHHERLSRRVSQPLFEEMLSAKESYV